MIFDSPVFTEIILPFLLVFVLIFAILQKSKVLGDDKSQIDALVALAVALILIGVETPRNIIVNLMPWLAVGAVVLLVFFILYGFAAGDIGERSKWMKIVFGILAGLFVIGAIIYTTGLWSSISDFASSGPSDIWQNAIFVLIIIGVIAIVLSTSGKPKEKKPAKSDDDD